jgi:hypothetical protein
LLILPVFFLGLLLFLLPMPGNPRSYPAETPKEHLVGFSFSFYLSRLSKFSFKSLIRTLLFLWWWLRHRCILRYFDLSGFRGNFASSFDRLLSRSWGRKAWLGNKRRHMVWWRSSYLRLVSSAWSDCIPNMHPGSKALRTPLLSQLFDLC